MTSQVLPSDFAGALRGRDCRPLQPTTSAQRASMGHACATAAARRQIATPMPARERVSNGRKSPRPRRRAVAHASASNVEAVVAWSRPEAENASGLYSTPAVASSASGLCAADADSCDVRPGLGQRTRVGAGALGANSHVPGVTCSYSGWCAQRERRMGCRPHCVRHAHREKHLAPERRAISRDAHKVAGARVPAAQRERVCVERETKADTATHVIAFVVVRQPRARIGARASDRSPRAAREVLGRARSSRTSQPVVQVAGDARGGGARPGGVCLIRGGLPQNAAT